MTYGIVQYRKVGRQNRKRLDNTIYTSSATSILSYIYDKLNEYTDVTTKKSFTAEKHSRKYFLFMINLLSSFKTNHNPTHTQKTL